MAVEITSILWRRLDQPGHEAARLLQEQSGWRLIGSAVFAHDGAPCRMDYSIFCDEKWKTRSADVTGWIGKSPIESRIRVSESNIWELNGEKSARVSGCIDVDLNFSPSTNLLPIRRLNLAVGEHATVRAAWLRFPSLTLEPLEQVYRRIGDRTYRYESAGGSFVAVLETNVSGFVIEYPNIWSMEASA